MGRGGGSNTLGWEEAVICGLRGVGEVVICGTWKGL